MRIEIWADVVCGWAYIGKRRLEQALDGWGGDTVEVVWRPYRIDPTAPDQAEPMDEMLRDPIVDTALRQCAPGLSPAENQVRVSQVAAAVGLGPRWGATWRANSHHAHRLLTLAYAEAGATVQDAVAERLMRAHFIEGRDISDRTILDQIAVDAGFPDGMRLLAGSAGEELLRDQLLQGRAMGVTSPTFMVGDQRLAGAQAPEVIREFLAAGHVETTLPAEVRRLRQAEALLERRDPLGALTLLGPLLAAHADDPNVQLLAARAYFASAQLGRAEQLLQVLVDRSPGDAYLRHLLGRTLQRQGRAAQAAPHLRLTAAMSPEYV
ncbi:DsbA family protein [Micromonospora sp. NPDC003197]